TTRSRLVPRPSRTSQNRSWVSGRGVSTPSSANAMAVASGLPMKIASCRRRPASSRRTSTGVLLGSSTRTATNSSSITAAAYVSRSDASGGSRGSRQQVAAHLAPQQRSVQLGAQLRQLAGQGRGVLLGLGVALLEQRNRQLLDHAGLALGGDQVHAQVTGLDAQFGVAAGQAGDLERGRAVDRRSP